MVNISLVSEGYVPDVWSDSLPFIRRALRYSHGEMDEVSVFSDCISSMKQLWLVREESRITAVAVTEIVDYSLVSSLRVVLLSGRDMAKWQEPLLDRLVKFAKDEGVTRIESWGRPGFAKTLKPLGFEQAYVAMIKEI